MLNTQTRLRDSYIETSEGAHIEASRGSRMGEKDRDDRDWELKMQFGACHGPNRFNSSEGLGWNPHWEDQMGRAADTH